MKTQYGIALFTALTLALTACGGPSTPDVASVSLTGNSSVAVGAAAQVTATPKDASGNAISTSVTYTSDQPNVIAVDNSGNLTVRRLTATDKPVTITATAGGKSATLQVTTYGLELALGTNNILGRDTATQPGLYAIARFRTSSGNMIAGTLKVQSPTAGSSFTCTIEGGYAEDWCGWSNSNTTNFPNGIYTATLTQGSITYTTSATISDRSNVLTPIQSAAVLANGRVLTFSGQIPSGTAAIYGYIYNSAKNIGEFSKASTSSPIIYTPSNAMIAGQYATYIYSRSFNGDDYTKVLPDQVNRAIAPTGNVTLP